MRLACLYDEQSNKYLFFTEKNVKTFIEVLRCADEVISYNGKLFDVLVLMRHYGLTGKVPRNGKHVDLWAILSKKSGFNVPLNLAAWLNLGESKHTDGRKMAMLDLRGLKTACRSDVSQTYRLWLLYKERRLRHPIQRPSIEAFVEAFSGIGNHMPKGCEHCGAVNTLESVEMNVEGLSDGQLADYEAGLRGFAHCNACGHNFSWHI